MKAFFRRSHAVASPTKEDWAEIRLIDPTSVTDFQRSVVGRVAFALYGNSRLEEKIERLEGEISYLESLSQSQFRKIRYKSHTQTTTQEDTVESEKLRKFYQGIKKFSTGMDEAQKTLQNHKEWMILLRNPDDHGSADLWNSTGVLGVDLALQSRQDPRQGEWPWQKIRLYHVPSLLQDPAQRLREAIDQRPVSGLQQRSVSLRTMFEKNYLQGKRANKFWKTERAHLALRYTNWVLLLWNTPWTANLCTSTISFADFHDHPRFHSLSVTSLTEPATQPTEARRLMLFGIFLTELALERPVELELMEEPQNEQNSLAMSSETDAFITIKIQVLESQDQAADSWVEYSHEDVLSKILKSTRSRDYCEAVSFCFEYSLRFNPPQFHADFIPGYIDSIFNR